jgi:hypothetical protein
VRDKRKERIELAPRFLTGAVWMDVPFNLWKIGVQMRIGRQRDAIIQTIFTY